jgi:hypothetical protein
VRTLGRVARYRFAILPRSLTVRLLVIGVTRRVGRAARVLTFDEPFRDPPRTSLHNL